MKRQQKIHLGVTGVAVALGTVLAINGCSGDPPVPPDDRENEREQAADAPKDGETLPISELPFIDAQKEPRLLGELLRKPTELGETTALHVRLPPPQNRELASSLVRVVGPEDSPQLLFSSDALERLGLIARSPGKDFFASFSTLPPEQLEELRRNQEEIEKGAFGRPTNESVVFSGRTAIARTINPAILPDQFLPGVLVPVNACPVRPASTQAAWDKALFIRDPAVVQDPARTWDPCTGAGTPGGVWTFAHLIREMAQGSGKTPENFAKDWLSMWLNTYVVNSDSVPARTQMFNQVIRPWAIASGVTATLVISPLGVRSVTLSGPLNLDIAPFRLVAIVNRIDLGETVDGPVGYNGHTTSRPTTAGELRFVFNVVQPNPWGAGNEATCGKKQFTTIFEYGVPGAGCSAVVKWAKKWTQLQAQPGFTAAYLAQLQSMTESVVTHGAAPLKGNQNAINQIRTNEIALAGPWELREFTLTDENPAANTDTPSNGSLRKHTVAMTPNDGAFPALSGDPTINAFVTNEVTNGVVLPVSNPLRCNASYKVPYLRGNVPFRGGNALIGPGHWIASSITAASGADEICARFQFSLNTCQGCHHDDTGTNNSITNTNFTHFDTQSAIPVKLSKFLTGGGPGLTFNVADTQLGTPAWRFADLERRYQRLWDLSHCTSCTLAPHFDPAILAEVERFGPLPIDPGPINPFKFKVGPITDLEVVQKVFDLRSKFAKGADDVQVDFVHQIDGFSE